MARFAFAFDGATMFLSIREIGTMTLRMDFEDHLDSLEARISTLLDEKRFAVARQLQCESGMIDCLTIEEVSEVVTAPVLASFTEKQPEYARIDGVERRLLHGLLDHWKAGIYLSQFPPTVKDMVRSFAFTVERLCQASRDPDLLALRKLLRGADLFDDHRTVLRDMRLPACSAAARASEAGDDLRCRELLQMMQASIIVADYGQQTVTIRTIANDNTPAPEALAPTM